MGNGGDKVVYYIKMGMSMKASSERTCVGAGELSV